MYILTTVSVHGIENDVFDTRDGILTAVELALHSHGLEGGFDSGTITQWIHDGLSHDLGSLTFKITEFSMFKVRIWSHKIKWIDTKEVDDFTGRPVQKPRLIPHTTKHYRTGVYATLGHMLVNTKVIFNAAKTQMLERGQPDFKISDAENLRLNMEGNVSQVYTFSNHQVFVRIDKVK